MHYELNCRGKLLPLEDKPVIMGILNITPDSFSDGGQFVDPDAALAHSLSLIEAGADIIDVGGESTRPGAQQVLPQVQIKRNVPVIKKIAQQNDTPISIDTTSAQVAHAALEAGASIINDISALRFDDRMAPLAAQYNVPVILMHMQGQPRSMQLNPTYENVVEEVKMFLAQRIDFALAAGISRSQIVIDPGIGFGKTVEHNLQLMRNLSDFHALRVPLLIGTSRKSFIGKVLNIENPAHRLFGTAATIAWAVNQGAHILRVHEVKEMVQTAHMAAAISRKS